jgi:hypothetical protein
MNSKSIVQLGVNDEPTIRQIERSASHEALGAVLEDLGRIQDACGAWRKAATFDDDEIRALAEEALSSYSDDEKGGA